MAFELLGTTILGAVDKAVNKVLSFDPAAREALEKLDGTIVKVQCTRPDMTLHIAVFNGEMHLKPHHDGEANVTIKGSAPALLQLLSARDKIRAFADAGLEASGDLDVLREIQAILVRSRPDWEYHLAGIIGDIPTQALRDGIDAVSGFAGKSRDKILRDLDEYLHREKRHLPAARELESFYASIHELRLRVDRAAARVQRLEQDNL